MNFDILRSRTVAFALTAAAGAAAVKGCAATGSNSINCNPAAFHSVEVAKGDSYWNYADAILGGDPSENDRYNLIQLMETQNGDSLFPGTYVNIPEVGACS